MRSGAGCRSLTWLTYAGTRRVLALRLMASLMSRVQLGLMAEEAVLLGGSKTSLFLVKHLVRRC